MSRIAISGSHGLIGTAVAEALAADGHEIQRLVRGKARNRGDIHWSPLHGEVDTVTLDGVDAVIHLAGEPIFGRWTNAKKQRIRDSRVEGTRHLCESFGRLAHRPRVLVCASAIGYYGCRGDELLTEKSGKGEGFLPEVVEQWEQATGPAAEVGVRVVHLRNGIVLSPRAGALRMMLPIFRVGLGGVIGSGEQVMSWVAIEDVVRVVRFALTRDDLAGPVNVVAPDPLTNRQFTETLGKVLHRPTRLPVPRFAARWAVGGLADEGLLCSARVQPRRLTRRGFAFHHGRLESALRAMLEKPGDATSRGAS